MSDEKISGGTLTRKPQIHQCAPPNVRNHRIEPGDRWVCDHCGAGWECKPGYDQREPDPYWARLNVGFRQW